MFYSPTPLPGTCKKEEKWYRGSLFNKCMLFTEKKILHALLFLENWQLTECIDDFQHIT